MLNPIALAESYVGPITHVEPVNGFVGNQNFRLHGPGGTYYLKSGPTAAEEARVCELVRGVGVPAPEVVGVGPEYLITRELAGRPLTGPHLSTVLRQAGECVRRSHALVDSSVSWGAELSRTLEQLDVLPTELASRVREVMPRFIDGVSGVTPVLLHGDLHPRHLYADGSDLTGILDWGDARYGDPLFDLARVSMAGPEATTAFRDGYGAIDAPGTTLAKYRVLWSLMALQAEHRAGGDWFQAHLDVIGRELR
jgi:hypothetical protein